MPAWLEEVEIKAARFAGLKQEELVQALLVHYGPEAGTAGTAIVPPSST